MSHDDRLKTLEAAVDRLARAIMDCSTGYQREEAAAVRAMMLSSEATPFQKHMSGWHAVKTDHPDAAERDRLLWNAACSQMKDYLRNRATPELKLAAFYTLVDQAQCAIAEPKPAGKDPEAAPTAFSAAELKHNNDR